MSAVHNHYENHLAPVYSWMAGGVESALESGAAELEAIDAWPADTGVAVDLGAGFGMHAIPLARAGFDVLAIDSSVILLDELRSRKGSLAIRVVNDDLLSFQNYLSAKPELVLCMGDTLTHLEDEKSVTQLIVAVSTELNAGGRFVATFRDYSEPLTTDQRFILVRSDEGRILTCFLEYGQSHVTVHDILHQRNGTDWKMSVSSYQKLRFSPDWLANSLQENGFVVERSILDSGMIRFVARRV